MDHKQRYYLLPDYMRKPTVDDIELRFRQWERTYKEDFLPGSLRGNFEPVCIISFIQLSDYLAHVNGLYRWHIHTDGNKVIIRLLGSGMSQKYRMLYTELYMGIREHLKLYSTVSTIYVINPLPKYIQP